MTEKSLSMASSRRVSLSSAIIPLLLLTQISVLHPVQSSDDSFFVEQPSDVTVFESENAEFSCRFSQNFSTCMFSYKKAFLLSNRNNGSDYGFYSTQGYCALTVKVASGDHDGSEFTCIVVTTLGVTHESNVATITVLIPPRSLQMSVGMDSGAEVLSNGEVRALAGETVDFTCQVVGARPAVNISWYLDDSLLAPEMYTQFQEISQNEVYDTHSTLTLTLTQKQHGADLSCRTLLQENVINELSQTKTLDVLYAPGSVDLNGDEFSAPVRVGDSVSVKCSCNSGNPLPTLKLYKDSQELVVYTSKTSRKVSVDHTFVAKSEDHSSLFKCEATSPVLDHTPVSSQQLLQVYFKPAAVQINGYNREIRQNDMVALECKTDLSYPASKISWTLNANSLGLAQDKVTGNSTHGFITTSLYEVQIDDDSISTVACEAENPMFQGIVTRDTVELQIQYMPSEPELSVEPSKLDNIYKEDDSVRLSCVSSGRPTPLISWFRDGVFLDSGADPVIGDDHTVKYSFSLSRLSRDDHGKTFSCSSQNVVVGKDQQPPTSSITFKIFYPPLGVTITSNVEKPFMENKQGVEFTCTTGKMNPNTVIFEWFVSGSPVNPSNTETHDPVTQSNGIVLSNTMKLNRPIGSDDHDIPVTCKVTPVNFPDMIVSDTYHMEVYFEPRLVSNTPLKIAVNESSKTVLDCGSATTNPAVAYYQWTGTKVVQTPGPTLEFLETSREDAGEYFCKACNCENPTNYNLCPWTACSTSRQITLQVEYAPELTSDASFSEVSIGSHAVLKCRQTANPKGQVFWMFEDRVIDSYFTHIKYNISVDRENSLSTLTVQNVVQADAGLYSCGVVNKLGEAQRQIQLAVKHAPYFESNENTRLVIGGRDGETTAVLFCVANGYPELNFDWINYPADQSTTKRIVQLAANKWRSELTIYPVRATSFGNYTCTAKNNMGADTWRVELSKPTSPGKPKFFSNQGSSHSSQTFRWTTGFNGGYPQTFEILYQVLGKENEGWKISSVNADCSNSDIQCNFTVARLAAATTYTFKVCAQNKAGPVNREEACSEVIQATTYPAPIQSAQKSFREMPFWLMVSLPTLTGLFIVTNLIFLALYCKKRFFNKSRGARDERPFSISTQSSSRADHAGMLYQDSSYYFPAGGSDRWAPGGGSDIGDKDHRYFGSPPMMNPMDLFERGTAASTHSDDVTTRMHISNEFDPACRVNPNLAPHPMYHTGPVSRGSSQWPLVGIPSRPLNYDSSHLNNEESYKNQIRQKARQGNRHGESYFAGESRSSTPVQLPLLSPVHPPAAQEQNTALNRYDSLAESHQESVSDCTNLESGRGSGCNLTASTHNQEHQSSLYSKKL